jgi:hypothetical protein
MARSSPRRVVWRWPITAMESWISSAIFQVKPGGDEMNAGSSQWLNWCRSRVMGFARFFYCLVFGLIIASRILIELQQPFSEFILLIDVVGFVCFLSLIYGKWGVSSVACLFCGFGLVISVVYQSVSFVVGSMATSVEGVSFDILPVIIGIGILVLLYAPMIYALFGASRAAPKDQA